MFDNTSTSDEGGLREQDRLLPIANVSRIMKQILPSNAKISKEAKETMQECVSEFIGFVTSEASERCRKERRKTINGDDICTAMATLGLDDMAGPLRRYLHRYREIEGEKERANQERNNNSDNSEFVRERNNDEQSSHSGVINILSHRNHNNQGEASTSVSEFDLEEKRNRYNNITRPF